MSTIIPKPIRELFLEECMFLTLDDRNKTYGDPLDNFKNMRDLAETVLPGITVDLGTSGRRLTASDMAMLMLCAKLSRIPASRGHKDSYIDAANYLAIAWECFERENGLVAKADKPA